MLAASTPPLLEELAVLAAAGAVIAYLATRVGTVPIVGFLLVGTVIGPDALGVIDDLEVVEQSADIGVVLLLFTIGIEFSLGRLRQLAVLIFGGGAIQVGLTTAVVTGLVLAAGESWQTAVYTALLVSLSSTAIVLKLLSDRGTTTTPTGRLAVSFLVFQDLAVVAMVLLVPSLGGEGDGAAGALWALGRALGIIVLVLVVARTVVPRLLAVVARSTSGEVFVLAVVGICFGTAYLTNLADVSVSLGAFLAGLIVSESRFSARAMAEILPLQILFSATFFVSVGMLLDLGYVVDNLPLVLGLAAGVLVLKAVITAIAGLALRRPRSVALSAGLVLAQVGEFSFVLERAGEDVGLVPLGTDDGAQTFIAVTVVLMVVTPMLVSVAERVAARLAASDRPGAPPIDADTPVHGHSALRGHVVVSGYGDRARQITAALERAGLKHLVTTVDPAAGKIATDEGHRVVEGDLTQRYIVEQAGLADARLLVLAEDEVDRIREIAAVARSYNPDLAVLAWVRRVDEAAELQEDVEIDHVVAEDSAAVDALIGHALGHFALPESVVEVVTHETLGTTPTRDAGDLLDPAALIHTTVDGDGCGHVGAIRTVHPLTPGCGECLAHWRSWEGLMVCLVCGHVGCSDDSPGRHARRHHDETGHPVVRSTDPNDRFVYCYVDDEETPIADSLAEGPD